MAEQLLLFPRPTASIEDAIQKILGLRRVHGTSGQAGEDVELIRAALIKEANRG